MLELRDEAPLADVLQEKIKVLYDSIWERRADWPSVCSWLSQFEGNLEELENNRLQALYLLSNFMYFGTSEIRALLKSLYRDVFRASIVGELRHKDQHLKMRDIGQAFQTELSRTRFVSLGNPSESSAFLLYYFRQENELPRECFISGAEIFSQLDSGQLVLRNSNITRYVFIDDMCGSGKQGEEYSTHTVIPLKAISPDVQAYYYALFGTSSGIDHLRRLSRFDKIHPVVELDQSFKCFCEGSRIYKDATSPLELGAGMALAHRFGARLEPSHPLGYRDGQLLLGFAYNTPDNSLPILWSTGTDEFPWTPVFKRYSKLSYG